MLDNDINANTIIYFFTNDAVVQHQNNIVMLPNRNFNWYPVISVSIGKKKRNPSQSCKSERSQFNKEGKRGDTVRKLWVKGKQIGLNTSSRNFLALKIKFPYLIHTKCWSLLTNAWFLCVRLFTDRVVSLRYRLLMFTLFRTKSTRIGTSELAQLKNFD